jgi:hypothetical protein
MSSLFYFLRFAHRREFDFVSIRDTKPLLAQSAMQGNIITENLHAQNSKRHQDLPHRHAGT